MNVPVNAHGSPPATSPAVARRPGLVAVLGVRDLSLLVDSESALRARGCQIARHA